ISCGRRREESDNGSVYGLSTTLQEQCLRVSVFVISRGCMLGRRRSIIARDFHSCLAKTGDQVLDEFGVPPLPEFVARNDGEVRSDRSTGRPFAEIMRSSGCPSISSMVRKWTLSHSSTEYRVTTSGWLRAATAPEFR